MKVLDGLVSGKSAPGWLDTALIAAVCIQIALCVHHLSRSDPVTAHHPPFWYTLYLGALVLLLVLVVLRACFQLRHLRHVKAARRQIDAMVSMFSSVKHELNNDMQVIVGNAELAQALLESGNGAMRPVTNISLAAGDAIDRIEQLSAFNVAVRQTWNAVDLNASLYEISQRLSSKLPPIVTFRLEPGRLPTRITANQYLLELSLSHLATQAAYSMPHGGEILVRTSELSANDRGHPTVRMDIFIVRALTQTRHDATQVLVEPALANDNVRQSPYVNAGDFNEKLETVKALLERSGARRITVSTTTDESLISLRFCTECVIVEPTPVAVLEETFS